MQGETTTVYDVKVPLNFIVSKYNAKDLEIEYIYYDTTTFLIKTGDNNILYLTRFFFTRLSYRGRQDILKAKEYIKERLLKKFDINQVAKTVNLSSYHFARLFKKHLGQTPYSYYLDLKFDCLKEKLIDPNLTVVQAFKASGLSYNGYFAKMFMKNLALILSNSANWSAIKTINSECFKESKYS